MSTPVPLRSDFDAIGLRMLARRSRDPDQTRRLLALAEIYDGGSRPDAARIGGVGVQIVRDWVVRFNAKGPDGLLIAAPSRASNRPCPNAALRSGLAKCNKNVEILQVGDQFYCSGAGAGACPCPLHRRVDRPIHSPVWSRTPSTTRSQRLSLTCGDITEEQLEGPALARRRALGGSRPSHLHIASGRSSRAGPYHFYMAAPTLPSIEERQSARA
jgi:hypothetical protein